MLSNKIKEIREENNNLLNKLSELSNSNAIPLIKLECLKSNVGIQKPIFEYNGYIYIIDSIKSTINNSKEIRNKILKEELDKCILLCSICHTELHEGYLTLEEIMRKI